MKCQLYVFCEGMLRGFLFWIMIMFDIYKLLYMYYTSMYSENIGMQKWYTGTPEEEILTINTWYF